MITALSVNLLFLINIVRIIITKLRNQPTLTTQQLQVVRIIINLAKPGNRNKGKGNGAGLA